MKFDKAREKIRNHSGPELYLDGTNGSILENLPPELLELKDLEYLNLSFNGLKTLPDRARRIGSGASWRLRYPCPQGQLGGVASLPGPGRPALPSR